MRRIALLLLLLPALAVAREPGVDVQQFKPVSDVQGFVLLHDATQLPQFRPGFNLTLNYGVNPLEVHSPGVGRQFGITDGIFGVDATGALGLFDWWEVALHFPIAQIPVETSFIENVGGKRVGYGIGDIRLETRLQPLDPETFAVGLSVNPFLTIPSGNERANLGRGRAGGGVRVAVSQSWTRVHFAVNLGWAFYPRATIANLTTGDELTFGAGVGFTPVVDRFHVRLELDGSFTPGPSDKDEERFGDPAHTPFEVLASAEYVFPFGLGLRGGVGKGITPGFGATDFRVFVGASYAIFAPIDRDRDGIADPDDACRREPEDLDGWEDADGCPDPDNDADGFADAADQCPDEGEDRDGFQDADGCPDQKPLAVLTQCKIEISDKVYFETGKAKILEVSYPLLTTVAQIITDNPDLVEKVIVEGHTDNRGGTKYNKRLSQRRAKAVAKFLRKSGVDKRRLNHQGYGKEKPIADNATRQGRSKNRRVEFKVLGGKCK